MPSGLPVGNPARPPRPGPLCIFLLLPLGRASPRLPADSGRSACSLRAPPPRDDPGPPPPPADAARAPDLEGGGNRCRQPHLGRLRPAVARSVSPSPATTSRGKPAIPALPSNSLPRGKAGTGRGRTPPLPPRARPAARGPDSSLLSGDEGRHSPTEVEVGGRDNLPARHHLWREKQPFPQRAELPYSSRGQTMNAAL